MAHLTRSDRGQLFVVTALALAVLFVALALLLNSAIFTENLASRGDTTGSERAVEYRATIDRGAVAALTAENRNATESTTHATVASRVRAGVETVNDAQIRRYGKSGAATAITDIAVTNGSRISQSDSTRNFTDGDGAADWTVVEDVDRTRAFRLNVTESELACDLLTACFHATITDGATDWRVFVNDTVDGVVIEVDDGTRTACDPVDEPFVTVDVTAGTIDGDRCPALAFADAPDAGYDVEYRNGDAIAGTYSLIVDNETVSRNEPTQFANDADPTVTAALYDVTVAYDYRTARLELAGERRVAPGEPDG